MEPAAAKTEIKGTFQMVLWPAVALVGFFFLTAVVIAMGTSTTSRYEREREQSAAAGRSPAAEPVGAARAV